MVAPTLIQEAGAVGRPVEEKRAELAAVPAEQLLTDAELGEMRAIGDDAGFMALKDRVAGSRGRLAGRPLGADRRAK